MAAGNAGLLDKVIQWANAQTDIIALIMTGSRAQPDGSVDAFSDYDLEIFATDPGKYTSSASWITEIRDVWVYVPTTSSRDCETILVVFNGGEKVDFSIFPVSALEDAVKSQALNDLYERGFRVLIDRKGLASRLPVPSYLSPVRLPPTETEFRAAVEEFWFETSHIPKYLERDDLWVVKFRDWTLKGLLLRMMEWQAVARSGDRTDVWQIGMRIKDWTSPDVWQRLHEVFARFDAADSWRALLATTTLFRDVARETANKLGYQYPDDVDDAISGYIAEFDDSLPAEDEG